MSQLVSNESSCELAKDHGRLGRPMSTPGSIKIFALYHQASEIYRSEVVEPLQTGVALSKEIPTFHHDNEGPNISAKNRNYAELTGDYWVWKSYLPRHPEVEYVGMCHYRRFLDFSRGPANRSIPFFTQSGYQAFSERFQERYSLEALYPQVSRYDVIVPGRWSFRYQTMHEFYINSQHPEKELDQLIAVVNEYCPDYVTDMNEFLSSHSGYYCLNFVMKRDLFDSFMTWTFDILQKLEMRSDWSNYHAYNDEKIAAYLAERFFNVWLLHQIRIHGVSVCERDGVLLVPDKDVALAGVAMERNGLAKRILTLLFDGHFISRTRRHVVNFFRFHLKLWPKTRSVNR